MKKVFVFITIITVLALAIIGCSGKKESKENSSALDGINLDGISEMLGQTGGNNNSTSTATSQNSGSVISVSNVDFLDGWYWENYNERTNQLKSKEWGNVARAGNSIVSYSRNENPSTPDEYDICVTDLPNNLMSFYNVNTKTKTYTRMSLPISTVEETGEIKTLIGNEMVEGIMCEHWRITWKDRPEVEDNWIDPAREVVIRQVIPGIDPTVVRNIREGINPAHLFEIPNDYTEERGMDMSEGLDMFNKLQEGFQGGGNPADLLQGLQGLFGN